MGETYNEYPSIAQILSGMRQNIEEMAAQLREEHEKNIVLMAEVTRLKAENECGANADEARKADLAQADQWGVKSMGARKANELEKEKKAATGGVTVQ